MGKLINGITGVVIGRTGSVTTYMRQGQIIVRTKHSKTTSNKTVKQLAQMEKLRLSNEFCFAFAGTDFFKKTYTAENQSGTGFNRATSAIMSIAISGTYPLLIINYAAILVSKGILPAAINAHAKSNSSGNIVFNWNNNAGTGIAKNDDQAVLAAYYPKLKKAIFSIGHSIRNDETAILNTSAMKGEIAHTYIGFISANGKDAADSVYLGLITL